MCFLRVTHFRKSFQNYFKNLKNNELFELPFKTSVKPITNQINFILFSQFILNK